MSEQNKEQKAYLFIGGPEDGKRITIDPHPEIAFRGLLGTVDAIYRQVRLLNRKGPLDHIVYVYRDTECDLMEMLIHGYRPLVNENAYAKEHSEHHANPEGED